MIGRRAGAGLTVVAQVIVATAEGLPTLRHEGAQERRISIEDDPIRHGRKSRGRIDGFTRHVRHDLDRDPIRAVELTSHWVGSRDTGQVIACKAGPVRDRFGYPKTDFALDWGHRDHPLT